MKIERRTVKAPAIPAWLRPRLSKEARLQLAIVQLQKLADVDNGVATYETLADLARDALTWSKVAELLKAGQREMDAHLVHVDAMLRHWVATGRAEFLSRSHADAVRLGVAYMEDLAVLTDRQTVTEAATFSENTIGPTLARMGL